MIVASDCTILEFLEAIGSKLEIYLALQSFAGNKYLSDRGKSQPSGRRIGYRGSPQAGWWASRGGRGAGGDMAGEASFPPIAYNATLLIKVKKHPINSIVAIWFAGFDCKESMPIQGVVE